MPSQHQLVSNPTAPVSCHAWNKDRTQLAISPNSTDVIIFKFDGKTFTKAHVLQEHTQNVTSIDWAPNSNKLVTCAQDRNAYVWEFDGAEWKPTLVILRINRAATCVKWSPNEDKFAVGSGARLVSVCHFEEDNDWWVSKHIKKPIRSTILSLDWHPNNCLLAVGSSDFKCRVFCAAIKGVDKKPAPTCWGAQTKFGELVQEFGTGPVGGGWIHDVAFSGDGNLLAYVGHDSSVYVADGNNSCQVSRLITRQLPFRTVLWVTGQSFIAAGHDYTPMLFTFAGGKLSFVGDADAREEKAAASKFSALDKFRNLDKRGTDSSDALQTSVKSAHQNAILELSIVEGQVGNVAKFATVGLDGKVVLWTMADISSRLTVA
ncbi:uncharacterized protein MONBRDRAFT_35994 [Monosiga brevicollis MX1]|uniref:Actin-related protein 2/3 complex subunit n=1 Tax=Monosiga brevicollis TaxID=81824 RepID=A9UR80_MONBE|nr:uncharacterized protein MONBRDRAFT_35994 [Monosiga brevicollis MX1]EDQ91877.1 predicted protein [Monosiga brevicollis MX1]|eukprot:XP_001743163.1 hypothetical protein [Monosiga brevicollis MX1]